MSSAHVKPLGGAAAGNVSFLAGRIPPAIEIMSKYMKDLDKELFRKILKVVVTAIEGTDCCDALGTIAESCDVPEEKLSSVVAGMHELLRVALRLPPSTLKQEGFREDLRELRISEEYISDFVSVVFGSRREALDIVASQQGPQLPHMDDFTWRVDVAISTSCLGRALQPSILTQIQLSDGTRSHFQVSVPKFQELRYNVALILKEMNDLEKRGVLKIQD
ncbi:COMM domain-containing protein 5 [Denticeps clupeoides]|uniref:COMM domain-containing protein 5 n=1 Tax=Denticeps clupeoides TaxID=299321 RepID=A0AAY4CZQ0_9TELE|nr:COMM domain-containing protein 5-like [Denticeps clupeoides]